MLLVAAGGNDAFRRTACSDLRRDALHAACDASGAQFVDFFRTAPCDPFGRAQDLYFGDDGVHPSSACHALCFRVIALRTGLLGYLRESPS